MAIRVRVLNEVGVSGFRQFLVGANAGTAAPTELLTNDDSSAEFEVEIEVESRAFNTKLDAASYLFDVLGQVDQRHVSHNGGLWSWLALFYLDQLLPIDANGERRRPLADSHYILASHDGHYDWRTYYRHLLATPYDLYRRYRERSGVLLCGSVFSHGDWLEQLGSRQEIISSDGLITAVNALYLRTNHPADQPCWKRGSLASANRPGCLRRLIKVVGQLDLTYDLYGMQAEQILELLPGEFNAWRGI